MVTGESVTEMADGLERILDEESLRAELSANGRRAAAELFSMAAVGNRLERVYWDITGVMSKTADPSQPKRVE